VGFEPTIPVFKRTVTVHALVHAATVIDIFLNSFNYTCAKVVEFCYFHLLLDNMSRNVFKKFFLLYLLLCYINIPALCYFIY
jgi:hypothetical protein